VSREVVKVRNRTVQYHHEQVRVGVVVRVRPYPSVSITSRETAVCLLCVRRLSRLLSRHKQRTSVVSTFIATTSRMHVGGSACPSASAHPLHWLGVFVRAYAWLRRWALCSEAISVTHPLEEAGLMDAFTQRPSAWAEPKWDLQCGVG